MPDSPVPDQIRYLREKSGLAQRIVAIGVAAIAVGLTVAGFVTREWGFAIGVVFCVLLVGVIAEGAPHRQNAIRAANAGPPDASTVTIVEEEWSDALWHHAIVTDARGATWRISFRPTGWKPDAGDHPAQVFSVSTVPWPVLIVTDAGLIYPNRRPRLL